VRVWVLGIVHKDHRQLQNPHTRSRHVCVFRSRYIHKQSNIESVRLCGSAASTFGGVCVLRMRHSLRTARVVAWIFPRNGDEARPASITITRRRGDSHIHRLRVCGFYTWRTAAPGVRRTHTYTYFG